MSMLNSLCNDNTKRLIPQLITHPIKLAVMHDVILDTAKFQLGISFFSFRKERKKIEVLWPAVLLHEQFLFQ